MKPEKENHPPIPETKTTKRWRSRLVVPAALVVGLALGIGGVLLWQNTPVGFVQPRPGQSQAPSPKAASPTFNAWQVSIKPEYIVPDMPHETEAGARKVLVDYQGLSSLPDGMSASLAFHVPNGGATGMVCTIDSQGRHYMASPQTTRGAPFDTVQFVSTHQGFHLALSYPAPAREAKEQVFEHPVVPLYPVDEMDVIVQQPPLAQNFSVEYENVPSLLYSTEKREEFTYHKYRIAAVDPGQKMLFRIRYTLPDGTGPEPVGLSSKGLPAFAYNSAVSLKSYRIARRIPDVLHMMPCYCGCDGAAKHKNLRDCFINAAKGEYESHASGCDLCSKIAIDVDRLVQDHSLKETRTLIEKQYGEYGKGTPTPPIGS